MISIPENELTHHGAMHALEHLEELERQEWPDDPLFYGTLLRRYITRLENLATAVEADPHTKTADVRCALRELNKGKIKGEIK